MVKRSCVFCGFSASAGSDADIVIASLVAHTAYVRQLPVDHPTRLTHVGLFDHDPWTMPPVRGAA